MSSYAEERQSLDLQADGRSNIIDENNIPSTAHQTEQKPQLTLLPLRHTKARLGPHEVSLQSSVPPYAVCCQANVH